MLGKSELCVQREREPTERVNIVREPRKESCERDERKKDRRAEKEIEMTRGRDRIDER